MSQRPLFPQDERERERDNALDLLEETREFLIKEAKEIATRIAREGGTVTSTEVLTAMDKSPHLSPLLEHVDRRFLGPVFRSKQWVAAGWVTTGSHARPVRVWRLKP